MTSIALARMVIAEAATSEPAKVVARKVGVSTRHIYNLGRGSTEPGITTALAFANAYPQVRAFFARALALEQRDARTEALLDQMQRWLAEQPEAGDQVQR